MLGSGQQAASPTAVLLEQGGSFFVYEPSLGIIASDATVEGAYRRFSEAKRTLTVDAERAGLVMRRRLAPVRLPPRPRQIIHGQRGAVAELAMFLAKTVILLLVLGAIGGALGITVGRMTANVKPVGMADIADKAAEIARDASSLSPEKKELLRESVGIVSRELAPVIDSWRNPPSR
jgi:hypothetical protein